MKFLRYVVAAAIMISALPAQAGSGSGTVHNIVANPLGIITFTLDTSGDCSTGYDRETVQHMFEYF